MKKLSKESYQRMRAWIYRYAFHVDLTTFQFFLEGGSNEAVVQALSFYQNKDGGFVSFDPDCWNPNSSPLATLSAYKTLRDVGIADKNHPMIKSMTRYIENCEYCTDKGCFWSIPSNNQYPCQPFYLYPHAPWHPADWSAECYTNGSYVDFALTYFDKGSPMYDKIQSVIDYRISIMSQYKEFCSFTYDIEQEIEANDWLEFILSLEKHGIKSKKECEELQNNLLDIIREYAKPSVYKTVTNRIKEREVIETYGYITDDILDEIIDSISNSRDWSENGLQCDNPEERLKEITCVGNLLWPIVELIDKLRKLKQYNRIEF
ncbi:MAG TPA: hypothetical protein VN258_16675 [Mobilitalea sp.]|nr:hypothetical protein [Mobilitalea sp.]